MVFKGPCQYGAVNRQMITDIKEDVSEVAKKIDKMDVKLDDLFNHQSSRLPLWATILFTIGGSLIVGLIVWTVAH